MRRSPRQWTEHRNEQRLLAECQVLVDAGEASRLEPERLSAAEIFGLESDRWAAVAESPARPEPAQLALVLE